MLRADRAKAPVSLAGLPATESHSAFLEQNRNSLDNIGGAEVQVAAISTDEDESAATETDAGAQDDAVVKVLRDMFTLFKQPKPATSKVRVVRPRASGGQAQGRTRIRQVQPQKRQNFNLNSSRQRNAERLRRLLQTR